MAIQHLALIGLSLISDVNALQVIAPQTQPAMQSSAQPPLSLTLRTTFVSDAIAASSDLEAGTVLHSGDFLRFFVKLDAPGYVYLLGRSDYGSPSVLYASRWLERDNTLFKVPSDASIQLGSEPAVEDLVIFAARQAVPVETLIGLIQQLPAPPGVPSVLVGARNKKQLVGRKQPPVRLHDVAPHILPFSRKVDPGFAGFDPGERNLLVVPDDPAAAVSVAEVTPLAEGIIYRRVTFLHEHAPAPPEPALEQISRRKGRAPPPRGSRAR